MSTDRSDARLADLADAVQELARRLDVRHPDLRDLVPLTGTEVAVIRQVHRRPRCTPTQIAAETGLQRSNVSTAVRALEGRGLLRREHPAGDARSVELVPTELADESVARIREFWAERLRRAPDDLLAEALAALTTLERLADAIGD